MADSSTYGSEPQTPVSSRDRIRHARLQAERASKTDHLGPERMLTEALGDVQRFAAAHEVSTGNGEVDELNEAEAHRLAGFLAFRLSEVLAYNIHNHGETGYARAAQAAVVENPICA